jgi:hypothetical protein
MCWKMGGFDRTIEFYGEDVDIGKRAKPWQGAVLAPLRHADIGAPHEEAGFARIAGLYSPITCPSPCGCKPGHQTLPGHSMSL